MGSVSLNLEDLNTLSSHRGINSSGKNSSGKSNEIFLPVFLAYFQKLIFSATRSSLTKKDVDIDIFRKIRE